MKPDEVRQALLPWTVLDDREREADEKLFVEFNSILPPNRKDAWLDGLSRNQWILRKHLYQLWALRETTERHDFFFHDWALQRRFKKLSSAAKKLSGWLATNFFVLDTDSELFMLYPELKNSDNAQKRAVYNKALHELLKLVAGFEHAYSSFVIYNKKPGWVGGRA